MATPPPRITSFSENHWISSWKSRWYIFMCANRVWVSNYNLHNRLFSTFNVVYFGILTPLAHVGTPGLPTQPKGTIIFLAFETRRGVVGFPHLHKICFLVAFYLQQILRILFLKALYQSEVIISGMYFFPLCFFNWLQVWSIRTTRLTLQIL